MAVHVSCPFDNTGLSTFVTLRCVFAKLSQPRNILSPCTYQTSVDWLTPFTPCSLSFSQTGSTVIGLFGFSGYNFPVNGLHNCVFCSQSTGQPTHFFTGQVPQTGGEGTYTASVIGSV